MDAMSGGHGGNRCQGLKFHSSRTNHGSLSAKFSASPSPEVAAVQAIQLVTN